MKDYSQILQQPNLRNQNPNFTPERNFGGDDTEGWSGQGVSGGGTKRTVGALANTLGAGAEAAKGMGIPRKVAHRIVDRAYKFSE